LKQVLRRKVKADAEKKILTAKLGLALSTKAALALRAAQIEAVKTALKKVATGTLLSIIKKVEEKYELPSGSVTKSTVIKRCYRNNPEAKCPQKEPQLNDIEGLLMEWLVRLSKMNEPLTKSEVMSLCDDLIRGTIFEEKMKEFCKLRHIEAKNSGLLVGTAWYEGFMQRYVILGVQPVTLPICITPYTKQWLTVVLLLNWKKRQCLTKKEI
jgi:hypothetical protein